MAKIINPMTKAANVRKCCKCGVGLQATLASGTVIKREVIMDEMGHMFCSWWCKDEYKKETDL